MSLPELSQVCHENLTILLLVQATIEHLDVSRRCALPAERAEDAKESMFEAWQAVALKGVFVVTFSLLEDRLSRVIEWKGIYDEMIDYARR